MLLGDILSGNARRLPDAPAWIWRDRTYSWGESNRRVNRLASALARLGLAFQDRAVIVANNSLELVELIFALAKLGVVAVPMAPRTVWRELAHVIDDVEARALFVGGDLVRALEGAPADLVERLRVVGIGGDHALPFDLDRLRESGDDREPEHRFSEDAMRTIRFTSGTTGTPKGCIGTHRTVITSLMSYLAFCPPVGRHDVCLMFVSGATGFGLNSIATYALQAAPTVILERFDAALALDAIERHRVTRGFGVPTMIALLTAEQQRRPRNVSSLAMFGYTGAPAPRSLLVEAMRVLGCDFYQGYGSTETGGRITYLSPEDHRALAHGDGGDEGVRDAWGRNIVSAGRELPGFEIRLVDDAMRPVPEGEVGEMMVRGDTTFAGYWRNPEATSAVIRDGWLLTRDLAVRTPDGHYYVVDRKQDMIVSGGYNVYSIEVETVLRLADDVVEAAVFGARDPVWGEIVCAAVVGAKGRAPEPDALEAHCRRHLAAYKVPRRFVLLDSLPMTSTGKVRKVELRERYARG